MSKAAIIAPRLDTPSAVSSVLLAAVFFASPFIRSAQAAPATGAAKPLKQAKVSLPRLTRAANGSSSSIAGARNAPAALNWRADPRARMVANFSGRASLPGVEPVSSPISHSVAAMPPSTASRQKTAAVKTVSTTTKVAPTKVTLAPKTVIAAAPVFPSVLSARSMATAPAPTRVATAATANPSTPVIMARSIIARPVAPGTEVTASNVAPLTVLTPQAATQPASTTLATLPKSEQVVKPVTAQPKSATTTRPDADRILLAKLEADLSKASQNLNSAQADLDKGQQSLSKFTNSLRAAMMEAGPDATGLHPFVRTAERYAGTPYVWGGESARGFDCSGFIIRVMRDLGYQALPHSAAEQFRYGKPIAQSLLKPGDLVFFKNTYKPGISHVGIYLGRRRFIHAAGTGTGTIVSSLDQAKFQAKYAGARRLISAR